MKTLIGTVAAMVVALSPAPALAAPAAKPSATPAQQEVLAYCSALLAAGTYATLNFGECVSFNSVSDQGFVPHFCDYIRENATYEEFGFTSYSDCVRNAR